MLNCPLFQIDSAMALTSLNSVYLSNSINRFFPMNGKVTVNATLEMVANPYTRSTVVKRDIQRKLIQVRQSDIERMLLMSEITYVSLLSFR